MSENEIIGNVHLRLRQNAVSDVEIMNLLEKKHLYGCKTNTALVKKALLFFINAKKEEATDITNKLIRDKDKVDSTYDSLFK